MWSLLDITWVCFVIFTWTPCIHCHSFFHAKSVRQAARYMQGWTGRQRRHFPQHPSPLTPLVTTSWCLSASLAFSSICCCCCCSVTNLCPILCDPMDCNTIGSPVQHLVLWFFHGYFLWSSLKWISSLPGPPTKSPIIIFVKQDGLHPWSSVCHSGIMGSVDSSHMPAVH